MMPPNPRPVSDDSAWLGHDLEGRRDWLHHLTAAHLQEIDDAVGRLRERGRSMESLTRQDFPFPGLGAFLQRFLKHDVAGRGFGVIRGLPRDRYSDEELGMLFWGIGLHMGIGVSQNPDRDLLGHVISFGEDLNKPDVRGYRTSARLSYHTDPGDVVGLMCLRTAKEGGLSSLVSGATIFNAVLAEHPEHLPLLFRGFRCDRRAQNPHFLPPISDEVPVFSRVDGQLSMRYVRGVIEAASQKLSQPLTGEEVAALDFLDQIPDREGIPLRLDFQEGDMQFVNNYTVLHSRTAFVDHDEPELKRHLLRLWLKVEGLRKLEPAFVEYHEPSGWSRREGVLPLDAPAPNTVTS